MELTQLRYFKTISDTRNISDASIILGVSQSTLTKSIQHLEQELQTELFDRIGNKLVLTDVGRKVLQYANSILSKTSYMFTDIMNISDEQTFRVCMNHPSILNKLSDFEEQYPEIPTYFSARYQAVLSYYLSNQIFDLVIDTAPIRMPGIECQTLFVDHLYFSVPLSHPLANKKMLHLSDLKGETIVGMNGAASIPLFDCFFSKLQKNDIPVNFISQGTSQACINYAKKRGHISYLSSLDVSSVSSEGETKNILLAPTDGVFVTYYASWLSNNHRPEIDSFIHWCNILI